jgi:hypothetical protein
MKKYGDFINENQEYKDKYEGFDEYLKENVLYEKYGLQNGNTSIGGYFSIYKSSIQFTIGVWFPAPINGGYQIDYEEYSKHVKDSVDLLKKIKEDFAAYKYWAKNNDRFVFEIRGEDFDNSPIVKEYFNIFKSSKGIDKYDL